MVCRMSVMNKSCVPDTLSCYNIKMMGDVKSMRKRVVKQLNILSEMEECIDEIICLNKTLMKKRISAKERNLLKAKIELHKKLKGDILQRMNTYIDLLVKIHRSSYLRIVI